MARVLVIGDIHAPVTHPGYLSFCKEMYKDWSCDKVVFVGDVVDFSAISFHANNPECPGPMDEYKLAHEKVQEWYRVFKEATVTLGNHDARLVRLAESVNIPSKFLRNYGEIWDTPGWDWVNSAVIDGVYYCHGHGKGGGKTPAFNLAQSMGMSVVMGHYHSVAGVRWFASPLSRYFGLDCGCGIDDKAFAFAYAKESPKKSLLGVGIVLEGMYAYWEPFPCGKGESYHRSNIEGAK
ncbi:MAG: metallophosphoesterase [Deltaproteobacteria bacterium]|nr:metallophosphoesterase [Deltaproteobacteria bacterium]